MCFFVFCFCLFQAEDGIRDLVRSRGLGDVYKRQHGPPILVLADQQGVTARELVDVNHAVIAHELADLGCSYDLYTCLLYTSDAADERSSVDLGGRRIIKKKTQQQTARHRIRARQILT